MDCQRLELPALNVLLWNSSHFNDGILTWGVPPFPCMEQGGAWLTWGYEQMWIDKPQAKYEVYITYQDNQPKTLWFLFVKLCWVFHKTLNPTYRTPKFHRVFQP